MRLRKFLSISSKDDDVNDFRSLSLGLVESDTGNTDIVRRLNEVFLLDGKSIQLLDEANKELKLIYRGKMKFDFCLESQGVGPDNVKINHKKYRQLKDKWFKFNDELSSIQNDFEKTLKKVYKSNR